MILAVCVFFLQLLNAQQTSEWEHVRDDNGIRVFTRHVEGSPIKQVRVENEMKTTLSALVSLMKDVDNHKNWTYANKQAEVLERHSEFSWIFYGYSNAPWPVADRDMVIKASLEQDSLTHTITNTGYCIPEFLPENDGVVRIQDCNSKWTLKPLENGNIMVSLEIQLDLGGSIPTWLLNMVITKGPYMTIKNMEEAVQKEPYRSASLDYILN